MSGSSRQNLPVDWPLVTVLGLALGLRVIALQARGIEYDDAFSLFLARQPFSKIVAGTAADTMPPLYYLLLHAWLNLGQSIWTLRLLNVVLSLGIVILAFYLGRSLWDRRIGLWLSAFAAVSPFQIFHAQGLRMYVLLTLASLSYLFLFARLWATEPREHRTGLWLGLIASGVVAMYSHNLAVFTLFAPNVLLLVRRQWNLLLRLAAAQALIGLAALPWLFQIPGQVAKVQAAFWTPSPGLLEVLQALVTFHTNLPVPIWLLPAAFIISVQVCVFVGIETMKAIRADPGTQLLAAFFLLPPIALFAISYLMRPVFVPRAFMLSSVAYYGLLARALVQTRVRPVGYLAGGAVLASALLALPSQYAFETFPRSPYQRAVEYLGAETRPGDKIVHDNKLSYFPARYYAPDLPQVFLPDPPGSANDTLARATQTALGIYPASDLSSAIAGSGRIWFVVFDQAIAEYAVTRDGGHPQLGWLRSHLDLVGRTNFNDLAVYLFESEAVDP